MGNVKLFARLLPRLQVLRQILDLQAGERRQVGKRREGFAAFEVERLQRRERRQVGQRREGVAATEVELLQRRERRQVGQRREGSRE